MNTASSLAMALSFMLNIGLFWTTLKKFMHYHNTKAILVVIGGFLASWIISLCYQVTAPERLMLPYWFISVTLFVTALMYYGLIHWCFKKYRKLGE